MVRSEEPCEAGVRDQRNDVQINQARLYGRQTGQVGAGLISAATFQYQYSFVFIGAEIGFPQNARLIKLPCLGSFIPQKLFCELLFDNTGHLLFRGQGFSCSNYQCNSRKREAHNGNRDGLP